jgi:hypothetical protein
MGMTQMGDECFEMISIPDEWYLRWCQAHQQTEAVCSEKCLKEAEEGDHNEEPETSDN